MHFIRQVNVQSISPSSLEFIIFEIVRTEGCGETYITSDFRLGWGEEVSSLTEAVRPWFMFSNLWAQLCHHSCLHFLRFIKPVTSSRDVPSEVCILYPMFDNGVLLMEDKGNRTLSSYCCDQFRGRRSFLRVGNVLPSSRNHNFTDDGSQAGGFSAVRKKPPPRVKDRTCNQMIMRQACY